MPAEDATMIELPLFPLNTVLFPGMPVNLHIFEDRYKLMIGKCIEEQAPFGVVLIAHGMEALGPLARPHEVGCVAQITRTERLSQGRLNIAAIGGERFRIHRLDHATYPYMVGQVELLPLRAADPDALAAADKTLRAWVRRYLEKLAESGRALVNLKLLPANPTMLAYLAATLLQIPAEQKQPLLEAPDAVTMITALHKLYRRELMLLDVLLHADPGDDENVPFSLS